MNERARSTDFRGQGARLYVSRYLVVRLIALAFSTVLGVGEVLAADYLAFEICGKKVDFDNSAAAGWNPSLHGANAGGTLCSVTDKDQDGYTTDDCNDSDPNDFPGVYGQNGCSAGQFRLCQSDGTYAAACSSTFTCPSSNCYFISTTGNDTAAGTSGAPWLTFGPITQNDPGGGTTRHTPVAGDTFVLRGGTYSTNKDIDSSMLYINSKDGNSSNRITIMSYPGETAVIASPNVLAGGSGKVAFEFVYADYWDIKGLKFLAGYGDPIKWDGDGASEGTNFRAYHNWFDSPRGAIGDNVNSIKVTNAKDFEIHNNYFFDWSAVVTFRAKGGRVHHNVAWLDSSASPAVQCISKKHADQLEAGDFTVDHNVCVNYNTAASDGVIWTAEQNSHIYNNLIVGCTGSSGVTLQGDPGGPSYFDAENIEYNTFINCNNPFRAYNFTNIDAAIGTISFTNNVIKDTAANYTGATLGLVRLDDDTAPHSETSRAALIDGGKLTSNGNCFYNASVSGLTGAFEVFPTASGGSSNNLTNWNLITGVGTDIEEDPAFDSQPSATSTNCLGKGWLATASSGGGGGGSTTGYVCMGG